MAHPYEIEFYEDEHGDSPVYRWIAEELSPTKRRAVTAAINEILARDGINICSTEFGKSLKQGLYELRIRQDADTLLARIGKPPEQPSGDPPEKLLLRVYFHAYGNKIVLLLAGYDKGRKPSPRHEQAQIQTARKRLKEWKSRKK